MFQAPRKYRDPILDESLPGEDFIASLPDMITSNNIIPFIDPQRKISSIFFSIQFEEISQTGAAPYTYAHDDVLNR